tara:strand:+ start:111 stop:1604 length:1494 start_codon:yes stop_codon:yes gene_type:complete
MKSAKDILETASGKPSGGGRNRNTRAGGSEIFIDPKTKEKIIFPKGDKPPFDMPDPENIEDPWIDDFKKRVTNFNTPGSKRDWREFKRKSRAQRIKDVNTGRTEVRQIQRDIKRQDNFNKDRGWSKSGQRRGPLKPTGADPLRGTALYTPPKDIEGRDRYTEPSTKIDKKGKLVRGYRSASDKGVERWLNKVNTKGYQVGSKASEAEVKSGLNKTKQQLKNPQIVQATKDKINQEYGGRRARRQNPNKLLNFDQIKKLIDRKNPTVTSKVTGGKLPASLNTPSNIKKTSTAVRQSQVSQKQKRYTYWQNQLNKKKTPPPVIDPPPSTETSTSTSTSTGSKGSTSTGSKKNKFGLKDFRKKITNIYKKPYKGKNIYRSGAKGFAATSALTAGLSGESIPKAAGRGYVNAAAFALASPLLKVPKIGGPLAVGTGFLLANRANKAYSQLTAPKAQAQLNPKVKDTTTPKTPPGVIIPPNKKKNKGVIMRMNLNTDKWGPA